MKIKIRPKLYLEAEPYKAGMEDGFLGEEEPAFINGPVRADPVQEGDWVIYGPAGRFVVTPEQMDADYEKVDA